MITRLPLPLECHACECDLTPEEQEINEVRNAQFPLCSLCSRDYEHAIDEIESKIIMEIDSGMVLPYYQ